MDDFEDIYSINAEIRYLTIELMKIAIKKKKSFKKVAKEFVKNTRTLQKMIKRVAAYKEKC
jgi:hypothetical protein